MVCLLPSSCLIEKHTIRFKNDYTATIESLTVGYATFGNVSSGQTTAYKGIDTGNFTISGTASDGKKLNGQGTIRGRGKHRWTLTLSLAGTLSIKEDK